MNAIHGIAAILACQLAGEVVVQLTRLPVPGPVIGMVLLFLVLLWRGEVPEPVRPVAQALLDHLALLFVPAGVGLMVHFQLIARDWVALGTALVVSTLVTLAATLLALRAMLALGRRSRG